MPEKIIHRIIRYLDEKNIRPTRFEKEVGLSNGYLKTQLKRNADLGESVINKIVNYCLDIDPVWLITGNSKVVENTDEFQRTALESTPVYGNNKSIYYNLFKEKEAENNELLKEIGRLEQTIKQLETELAKKTK